MSSSFLCLNKRKRTNYDEIMAILDEKDDVEESDDEEDLLDPAYVEVDGLCNTNGEKENESNE